MLEPLFGVLALFPSAEDLLKAIGQVKKRGFTRLEAYTPYPVHGLDEALGLPKSKLGVLVFIMASLGAMGAFLFEWWTSTVSYPLLTAGKAYNGWPAWIPVTLEGTILVGTFTAAFAMLFVFNKLPFFGNPMLKSRAIDEITRDKFALLILPEDGELDTASAIGVLKAAGGTGIEVLPLPRYKNADLGWWAKAVGGIAAACLVAGFGTAALVQDYPRVKPMVEMENQPRLDPEMADTFFASGRGMQLPPVGTVPRAYMPILAKTPEQGGRDLIDPLPTTARVLERGRDMFNIHCAVCHDKLGTGKPWLETKYYQAVPANLQSATLRKASDGFLYWVMSNGYATMPSYAADISPNDRWAIVQYVRALQRSQDAPAEDLK